MKLSWKLLPIVAASALALLVLMPGGGARPVDVSANDCPPAEEGTIRIHILEDSGAETEVEGFQITISPDPSDHTGTLTAIDNGANDDAGSDRGQIDIDNACQTDHSGFTGGYDINLSIISGSDADDEACVLLDDEADNIEMTGDSV